MPPSHQDDLDWLYGHGQAQAEAPEHTRLMPVTGVTAGSTGAPATAAPAAAPPDLPAGYPAMPTYGAPPPLGPGGPGDEPGPPARPPRRRHPVRTFFLIVFLVVVLAAGWLVAVPLYAWSTVDRVAFAPAGDRPANQPGLTYLMVGSDSREGLTKAEQKKLGTGGTAGRRTDTIMLMYLPPSGKPALISIPRDSYVSIPGYGQNKINAAYAFGGAKLLTQTVEQNTGLRVDAYMEIGFGGFVNIIDALGGIEMCLPKAIKDHDSHLDLKKGCQTLSGVDALGYVRMRKADPRGDLGRVERQRAMLAGIAQQAATPATILNPVRYWRVCNAVAEGITIGRTTTLLQTARMALGMRSVASGDGLTLTVPVSDPGASTPVGSAVVWDEQKAKAMFADIAKGDTSRLSKYAK